MFGLIGYAPGSLLLIMMIACIIAILGSAAQVHTKSEKFHQVQKQMQKVEQIIYVID